MSTLDHLYDEPRWVGWLNEPRGPEGKLTKVPYSPSGRKAEADDPATWGTKAEAELVYKRLANGHGGGIGIELGDVGGDLFLCGSTSILASTRASSSPGPPKSSGGLLVTQRSRPAGGARRFSFMLSLTTSLPFGGQHKSISGDNGKEGAGAITLPQSNSI